MGELVSSEASPTSMTPTSLLLLLPFLHLLRPASRREAPDWTGVSYLLVGGKKKRTNSPLSSKR